MLKEQKTTSSLLFRPFSGGLSETLTALERGYGVVVKRHLSIWAKRSEK
jgi:hypothetical protein